MGRRPPRATAARNLIRASVPERIAILLTGHKSRAIFDRYNIIHEQELLETGDQLVAYLAQHAQAQARPAGARTRPARAPRRPSASCDAPPRKRARGASGETGLNTIVRDRDVAQPGAAGDGRGAAGAGRPRWRDPSTAAARRVN